MALELVDNNAEHERLVCEHLSPALPTRGPGHVTEIGRALRGVRTAVDRRKS